MIIIIRFRTLTTAYYRGAMGILLMYDITSLESFNNLSYWLRNIQEVMLSKCMIIFFAKLLFFSHSECCSGCSESFSWK